MPNHNCSVATQPLNRNWIKIKLVGVKSNRFGIGSRILVTA